MYKIFLAALIFLILSFAVNAAEVHTKAIGDRIHPRTFKKNIPAALYSVKTEDTLNNSHSRNIVSVCKGEGVNVRARPEANSEIVTQLGINEDVIVLEDKGEWIKIKSPSHSKCWVQSNFIASGVINKESVNLRCGPGTAYPVLIQMSKGTPVKTLEIFGEWTKIEPPVEFGVWVSAKYLEIGKKREEEVPLPVKEAVVSESEVQKGPATQASEPVVGEMPQVILVSEEEVSGVELISFAGKLEDMGIIVNRPGTYKLVSEKGKWICIVRSPTLDINSYANKTVRIEGVVLSKTSTWKVPVVELKKLSVIK